MAPAENAGDPGRAAVVCHPHPLYGGSMYNNVVEAIVKVMWRPGYATLRFNFRGVGSSRGEHGGGAAEKFDVAAAVAFVSRQCGLREAGVTLAGYSFGATVAMSAGFELKEVGQIVAVALPLALAQVDLPAEIGKPVFLVAGDRDPYCPVHRLRELAEGMGRSARLEMVSGADHFFAGCEESLAAVIAGLLGVP